VFTGISDITLVLRDDNHRHAYFITALEDICKTLEKSSNRSLRPCRETTQAHDELTAVELLNRFAALTVEEPRESVEIQPASAVPQEIVMVEIVEERQEQEAEYLGYLYFRTLCLLSDLHSLQAFISKIWSEYVDCDFDLMTHRSPQTAPAMAGSAATAIQIGVPYNEAMADLAEWCFLPTFILLKLLARVLKDHPAPLYQEGHFGTYEPRMVREELSLGGRHNEDKILLFQCSQNSAWWRSSESNCLLRI
jgi:hypothetical protein